MKSHVIGFPRIGEKRELKKSLENFWKGKISLSQLLKTGEEIKKQNWEKQNKSGLSYVTTGDFSFYDHILDTSIMVGAIPERFDSISRNNMSDLYFAMARGDKEKNIAAMDMKKWFNTNYHYIVPEFKKDMDFKLIQPQVITDTITARALGYNPKAMLTGLFTYLYLGGSNSEYRYTNIEKITEIYCSTIEELSQLTDLIQIDEPILCTDLPEPIKENFSHVYKKIKEAANASKIIIATYFGELRENFNLLNRSDIDIIHLDCISGRDEIDSIVSEISPSKSLSLGLINGRNIWKNDLKSSLERAKQVTKIIGKERVFISSSCSLLHSPVTIKHENILDQKIKSWFSFAEEKLEEIAFLTNALDNKIDEKFLNLNQKAIDSKKNNSATFIEEVRSKTSNIDESVLKRKSLFHERIKKQHDILKFPILPLTSIGSFPQTSEIRKTRNNFKKSRISSAEYEIFMKNEIKKVIKFQSEIGLDVLVHGEPERNDMVEYFGEHLEGFCFTENGWVQSYGSRCVKPPIIYGDIYRRKPITVKWIEYANSLTKKHVKGMLTGPVTILNWSFEREDVKKSEICKQIAFAIRDEVSDLEKKGIKIIQIDEAALREGLPLRRSDYNAYLSSAVQSFCIASSGVDDTTQIHTHMCYSEFNSIMEWIAKMDTDVISIESSRSKMKLLQAFEHYKYPNEIGPGVYDIHSERIPNKDEIIDLLKTALNYIPKERLWVNPDCGLKTRKWPEVEESLKNLVSATLELRETVIS